MHDTSDVAFTDTVKRIQEERGSRRSYERVERSIGGFPSKISPDLAAFIQHRGGPPGFLNVLDDRTLAFADFAGNKQYITTGNLLENDRAFLFR
jgi:predicted pyridoxine 5'-phosphate oxidase superfamily flavin-nucleotide-binding protein